MRAAVQQIFTLELQRGVRPGCTVLAFGQRGWTPGIVFQPVSYTHLLYLGTSGY